MTNQVDRSGMKLAQKRRQVFFVRIACVGDGRGTPKTAKIVANDSIMRLQSIALRSPLAGIETETVQEDDGRSVAHDFKSQMAPV
jgi:hypothetical protein